jgi:PHP domain-containing protein
MKADMHMHSYDSDGALSPAQLVKNAIESNYELICLTDHNNFNGIQEFLQSSSKYHIKGIAGIEIDCACAELEFDKEILAYFPNYSPKNIEQTKNPLDIQLRNRYKKAEHYLKRASKLFGEPTFSFEDFIHYRLSQINISESEKEELFRDYRVSFMKPDIFHYLIDKKITQIQDLQYKDFKKRYFDSSSKDPDHNWDIGLNEDILVQIELEDIVKSINADGGYAVIPHPALELGGKGIEIINDQNYYKKVVKFCNYCKDIGVWGIENYFYNDYNTDLSIIKKINAKIESLAYELEFNITYGSDFHGQHGSNSNFGVFYGDFPGFQ